MIDDISMRRFSRETQRNYIREVRRLATFLGRSAAAVLLRARSALISRAPARLAHRRITCGGEPRRGRALLDATTCLKHKAALSAAYGAGLRVAEVLMLNVTDIDSERMLPRVERGKEGYFRNVLLFADLLSLLRQWWTSCSGLESAPGG